MIMGCSYIILHGISQKYHLSRIGLIRPFSRPHATRRRHHDRRHPPSMLSNPFHFAHAITSIKTLIPTTLDIKNPNYQRWSHFFSITAARFSLSDLLNGKPCPQIFLLTIGSEPIYCTISDDLSSMIFSKTASSNELWNSLASLFTDNNDYRAIQLDEKFKSLKKGSFSIHDYCQLLKNTVLYTTQPPHPNQNPNQQPYPYGRGGYGRGRGRGNGHGRGHSGRGSPMQYYGYQTFSTAILASTTSKFSYSRSTNGASLYAVSAATFCAVAAASGAVSTTSAVAARHPSTLLRQRSRVYPSGPSSRSGSVASSPAVGLDQSDSTSRTHLAGFNLVFGHRGHNSHGVGHRYPIFYF